MLPGLSGEDVLPKIQGVPSIVVSAKVDVQDKVKLLLGGAADYITKPFDTAELLARIAVQLRKAGSNLSDRIIVGDLQFKRPHPAGQEQRDSADEDRVCHFEAADAESGAGHYQVCHVGQDQLGHPGLHRKLPQAACQQPSQEASGCWRRGYDRIRLGHWFSAGGKILTKSLRFS